MDNQTSGFFHVSIGEVVVNGVTYKEINGQIYRVQNGYNILVTDPNEKQMLNDWSARQPSKGTVDPSYGAIDLNQSRAINATQSSSNSNSIILLGGILLLLYLSSR